MRILIGLVAVFLSNMVFAQNYYLQVHASEKFQQKILDSLYRTSAFENPRAIVERVNQLSNQLSRLGYLQHQILSNQKVNDSTFAYSFELGSQINKVKLSLQKSPVTAEISKIHSDTINLNFAEVEGFMQLSIEQLEARGYSMSKLFLDNFSFGENELLADLVENVSSKRQLNDIVILGYDKFPDGFKRQLKRMYKNRTFNQQTLKELYEDVDKMVFVNQIKSPEVLFTSDSTRVFLYLEKAKANSFDGYVGFASDENDEVVFTGYVDLLLNNALNSGEEMKLYWKNDGNKQQIFDVSAEVPYIFSSPLAIRGNLNIFKQDSTFQTTKINLDLGYYFRYNLRSYVGYYSVSSNDIQGVDSGVLTDYKSKFYTVSLEYFKRNREDFLFPEKQRILFKTGFGNRTTVEEKYSQYFVQLQAKNNFYLNPKNIIHLKIDNYFLNSSQYVINELYRFGGINSIRGFNENSLQASFFSGIMSEYRYMLAPGLYVHSITDYAYFQDKATDINHRLLGVGFGFGLFTNNGLFNLVYANGRIDKQEIRMSNSIVHLSFKANF